MEIKAIPSICYFTSCMLQQLRWSKAEAGTQNSVQLFHVDGMDLAISSLTQCLPRCAESWNWLSMQPGLESRACDLEWRCPEHCLYCTKCLSTFFFFNIYFHLFERQTHAHTKIVHLLVHSRNQQGWAKWKPSTLNSISVSCE